MPELLLATSNQGKVREYRELLKSVPFDLISLSERGIENSASEDYATYQENALHKAVYYASIAGLMTLADDSGLEVDALNGEPGVLSARYAGEQAGDAERVRFLLNKIKDIPRERRTARFKCVIAIALPQGKTDLFFGQCEGIISFEPKGKNGFGYDPVFYFPELDKTMAELEPAVKNRVSHRAIATQKAAVMLNELAGKAAL